MFKIEIIPLSSGSICWKKFWWNAISLRNLARDSFNPLRLGFTLIASEVIFEYFWINSTICELLFCLVMEHVIINLLTVKVTYAKVVNYLTNLKMLSKSRIKNPRNEFILAAPSGSVKCFWLISMMIISQSFCNTSKHLLSIGFFVSI